MRGPSGPNGLVAECVVLPSFKASVSKRANIFASFSCFVKVR